MQIKKSEVRFVNNETFKEKRWVVAVEGEDGTMIHGEAASEEAAEACRIRWEDDIRKKTFTEDIWNEK